MKNIQRETGLTSEEVGDLSALTNIVLAHPDITDEIIAMSGQVPADEPDSQVMQLVVAAQSDSDNFSKVCANFDSVLSDEFLGGIGSAIGALAGKVAGAISKGGAGQKVKGFFKKVFTKEGRQQWKEDRAIKKENRQQERELRKSDREPEPELRSDTPSSPPKTNVPKERADWSYDQYEEAIKKAKTTNRNLMIGLTAVGIGFVGVLIWAFAT